MWAYFHKVEKPQSSLVSKFLTLVSRLIVFSKPGKTKIYFIFKKSTKNETKLTK